MTGACCRYDTDGGATGGAVVRDTVVAKVRVVLYIEDLGPADETALPLQPRVVEAAAFHQTASPLPRFCCVASSTSRRPSSISP